MQMQMNFSSLNNVPQIVQHEFGNNKHEFDDVEPEQRSCRKFLLGKWQVAIGAVHN